MAFTLLTIAASSYLNSVTDGVHEAFCNCVTLLTNVSKHLIATRKANIAGQLFVEHSSLQLRYRDDRARDLNNAGRQASMAWLGGTVSESEPEISIFSIGIC